MNQATKLSLVNQLGYLIETLTELTERVEKQTWSAKDLGDAFTCFRKDLESIREEVARG